MKRLSYSLRLPIARVLIGILAIAVLGYVMVTPRPAAAFTTFTVNTTLDLPDISPATASAMRGSLDAPCAPRLPNQTFRVARM